MANALTWLTPAFINRLEALQLSVKWVRAGNRLGGRFPINRRGSSVEFADYAAYCAGDDIRAIDWNLYARLDRLFVKTYKEEVALSVELLVDATPSMGLPSPEKFERAKRLAVSLGYVGLAGGHHVRLSWICAGSTPAGPWCHRRNDLFRLAELAAETGVDAQVSLADWMERAAITLRLRGGQAILITDGMSRPADFFRALHVLMVRNLEVKVIQVLTPQELHPARLLQGGRLVDSETGATHELAYTPAELERAVAEHNETLVRFCKRHGIPFARHRLDESLETFITKTLPVHGFLE
ncbi:MAG: hypothetical protein A3C53_07525 [Omnitrophica WOR_2 bacterium RIFCSPHIGHO2_02_FULL_68_15]|nr:MAG: hypothetical protein A3C53_07525 [Omnitrophica WOR_2 bacterium RIFCSPHIGHO2_02_FULL_68_15]